MVVFDVTDRESFKHCDSWINLVKENAHPNFHIVLVGNKTDISLPQQTGKRHLVMMQSQQTDLVSKTFSKKSQFREASSSEVLWEESPVRPKDKLKDLDSLLRQLE